MHSKELEEVVGLKGGLRVGGETDVESGETRVRGLEAGTMAERKETESQRELSSIRGEADADEEKDSQIQHS